MKNNQKGKLYLFDSGVVINLVGQPIVSGVKTIAIKLRCGLCSTIVSPAKYKELKEQPKYSASCHVAIAINKYSLGNTFTRIEQYQEMLGIPLPKSTQWDLVNELAFYAEPAVACLEYLAAQSKDLSYDDSPHRILNLPADAPRDNVKTTAIIATYKEYKINLFYTGTNLAGENIEELLKSRVAEGEIINMTDASSDNFSGSLPFDILTKLIICFCLVHGRRGFHKLLDYFEIECSFVIDCISKVYKNELYCKKNKLSMAQRLLYHQEHSAPIMHALRVWLVNQLKFKNIEPNSKLGQAIKYMLKNWKQLTMFLHIEGAPIDNNATERLVKISILHRKNSLFYRTPRGAKVGSILMSLIQTAKINSINAFNYLVALYEHSELVKKNPESWLPWNYTEHIKQPPAKEAA